MRIENYKQYPLFAAICELNERLSEENIEPITLNVVGGFALMVHDIRKKNELTDVDYVGTTLPQRVVRLSEEVGKKYLNDPYWLNNDLMLTGTDIDDLEYSTGKLHFLEAFKLNNITVNILTKEDLLKMKLISVDTALSAVELGGEFTRFKDFNDIKLLLSGTQCDLKGFIEENKEHIINDKTYNIVNEYLINGLDAVTKFISQIESRRRPLELCAPLFKPGPLRAEAEKYERTPYIDKLLNDIITKNNTQKKREQEYAR